MAKRDKGIRVSEKHGLNPSLLSCPCCGADAGLALNGRLPEDREAPRHLLDVEPCKACQERFDSYRSMGFVLFGIDPEYERRSSAGEELPVWPFFREVQVITHEAAGRLFPDADLSKGAAFTTTELFRKMGFPEPKKSLKEDDDGKTET